jgi:23S rRNA pseudouridine1911/1915/1917 synthase
MSNYPERETINLVVESEPGQRLDRWVSARLAAHSRSAIQRWIRQGCVLVDGVPARASTKTELGQQVQVDIPPTVADATLMPEAILLDIVYEDADLLVINKPAGMVVHPAPGHSTGTLVHAVLHHCPEIEGVGGVQRPGIVHRLDRETSGLIVVAKHDQAQRNLQAQFKDRTVYKEYTALVEGRMEPAAGRIVAPIGRHPVDRKRQAVLPTDPATGVSKGRDAVTEYHTQEIYAHRRSGVGVRHFSLVRVVLHTGRTHQIRVHFAWQKHPVVGDTLYGYRRQALPLTRHFLHAHRLRLRLPSTGEEREFVAPLPAELQAILTQLEQS